MSPFPQRSSLFLVALVVALMVIASSPLGAQIVAPEPPPQAPIPSGPMARDGAAIDRLGRRLPTVARRYRLDGVELRDLFRGDPALAVDPDDELVYLDPLAPGEEVLVVLPFDAPSVGDGATGREDPGSADDAPSADGVFDLASLPGAENTIYLDFDGHVTEATSWNSAYDVASIVSPPYDLDGRPDAWSTEELDAIVGTWASVAVAFDPWNVNVTTIEPPVDDLRRLGDDDTRWGARVVFTADTFARCGCGGQTYVGAFDDDTDEPTFVHNVGVDVLAEAAIHQVGHMLGLIHDGSTIGTTSSRDLGPRPADSDGDPADGSDDSDPADGSDGANPADDSDGDPADGSDDSDPTDDSDDPVDVEAPASPVGVIGVDLGGTVFLGWAPNGEEDLAGYVVEWSASPDGPFIAIAAAPLNGHLDHAPSSGENHYRVSAEDRAGNRSTPADLMVVVGPVGPVPSGAEPA